MAELKPLDAWRFKINLKNILLFSWYLLVILSKITIIIFVLVTCIVFWENVGANLLIQGINILKPISQMFMIIFIAFGLICIDIVRKIIQERINKNDEDIKIKEAIEKANEKTM